MLYQNVNHGTVVKQSNKSTITTNDLNKKVKNLLLQGWRNRWTAPQFTTYLKQLSIVSVSGDHYELSKLILQQATVGRQPVVLFIDYLHHLLSCSVVSFSSTINSIIETCKKENTQVVICLLDFLLTQESNINCFSSGQDCHNLATSLARLVKFVFSCLEFSLQRFNDLINSHFNNSNQINQHEQAIEKCSNLLTMFKISPLLLSLIYVGMIEEDQMKDSKSINFQDFFDLKEKLFMKTSSNKSLLASLQNVIQFIQTLQKYNPNLQAKKYLQFKSNMFNYRKSTKYEEMIDESFVEQTDFLDKSLVSLNCVVTFDAILNPKAPSINLAYQLYNIAIINHLKFSLICCELIKCSFINFSDSLDQDKEQSNLIENKFLNQFHRKSSNSKPTKENVRWASFIYFKLPLVLKSLKQLLKERNSKQSLELEKGLERLINYTPLLELIDYKTGCDCLANLLIKFVKVQLVDDQFQKNLLKRKDEKIEYFNNLNGKMEKDVFKKQNLLMIQGSTLLDKAEPTVESILISLNPEITNKPENTILVFVKVIIGNSIEIVLNTLNYTGKLGKFIKRIIHFNEMNNQASNGENSKQAVLRGNLFDISFLILFYIVQEHGQEIILNCLEEEGVDLNRARNTDTDDMEIDERTFDHQNSLENSFFVKFCLDYLPENLSKVNYEEKFAKNIDTNKVDGLLNLFSNDNFDYQMIKWNEVLINSIGVFKELIQAHLNDHLSFEDLTGYLINMIKRNCSIGLLMAFYAINYMNTVCLEHKKKIFAILNFISNSNNFQFAYSNQSELFAYYKEKHTLAVKLIRNMMDEQIPKTILEYQQSAIDQEKSNGFHNLTNNEISQQIELYKVLKSSFTSTIKRGWLSTSSIFCFNKVLCVGGATWFMDKLIKLLLYDCEIDNLPEGIELIYGLSTLDMEQCCLALLNTVIPHYLVSQNDQSALTEPKLIALAKLIASITFSVLELDLEQQTNKSIKSIIHRNSSHYIEDNFIQYEDRLTDSSSNEYSTPVQYIANSSKINPDKQLLLNSISRLLRLVSSLLDKQEISQRTAFSLILLEQLVYTFPCIEQQTSNYNQSNDFDMLISSGLKSSVQTILRYLPFDTILNLVRVFPKKINYDLLLSISNLQSSNSRKLASKSLCQLSRSQKLQML